MAEFDVATIRHSAAHIMAAAVQSLYEDVKFDIGPSTDDGFYYDFDMEHKLSPDDLKKITKAMHKIINKKVPFEYRELTREEAAEELEKRGQTYKLGRLADIPEGDKISFYQCGNFIDLCRGPHVEHSGQVPAFKLLSIAGSYYRGNENNPMLQRVYGTAFPSKKDLNDHLQRIEEAKKRDHRKLGKELDLFSTSDNIGPGLICWHPKGGRIRHKIESFWKDEHYKNGYELLYTPHVGKSTLWETSGHLDFYRETMFSGMEIDNNEYFSKPMNCPFHIEIYKSRSRSYRELPLRWGELGTVYRYEKSGVLHGLLRVRGFTQDDAHIICTPEQIEDEITEVLRFSLSMWEAFGFKDIKAYLATRPEKAVGDQNRWGQAMKSLEKAVRRCELDCEIDEGGGAFYGPKIDLKIKDAIGREWQTTTIQFDFNLPERFNMTYVGSDGNRHQPYMVHRALLGSLERFFGILVEHYAGGFPVWLAPEQVRLLPVGESFKEYADDVCAQLRKAGVEAVVDAEADTLGAKIRRARNERLPYMLIIGQQEVDNKQVTVRKRGVKEQEAVGVDAFIGTILREIAEKS